MEAVLIYEYVDKLTVGMMKLIGDFHEYENVPKTTVCCEIRSLHSNRYEKTFFCDVTMCNLLKIYRRVVF